MSHWTMTDTLLETGLKQGLAKFYYIWSVSIDCRPKEDHRLCRQFEDYYDIFASLDFVKLLLSKYSHWLNMETCCTPTTTLYLYHRCISMKNDFYNVGVLKVLSAPSWDFSVSLLSELAGTHVLICYLDICKTYIQDSICSFATHKLCNYNSSEVGIGTTSSWH